MDLNIKTFNLNQLQNENKYITETYLYNLTKVKKIYNEKSIVILNNQIYTMYENNNFGFDIILVPNNHKSFKDDVFDIIEYSGNDHGLHFSIFRKKDGCAELIVYDFITNDIGYSVGNYRHNYFVDYNNQIQQTFIKSNKSIKDFIQTIEFYKIFNSNYNMNRIKRNSKETKLNRVCADTLSNAYQAFDTNFEFIDDNETPILKLLENIEKAKIK